MVQRPVGVVFCVIDYLGKCINLSSHSYKCIVDRGRAAALCPSVPSRRLWLVHGGCAWCGFRSHHVPLVVSPIKLGFIFSEQIDSTTSSWIGEWWASTQEQKLRSNFENKFWYKIYVEIPVWHFQIRCVSVERGVRQTPVPLHVSEHLLRWIRYISLKI